MRFSFHFYYFVFSILLFNSLMKILEYNDALTKCVINLQIGYNPSIFRPQTCQRKHSREKFDFSIFFNNFTRRTNWKICIIYFKKTKISLLRISPSSVIYKSIWPTRPGWEHDAFAHSATNWWHIFTTSSKVQIPCINKK